MKAKSEPNWFRVVTRCGFNVGPTIPFIIGATQAPIGARPPSVHVAKQHLVDLIESMRATRYGVSIQLCKYPVGDLVVTSNGLRSLTWQSIDGCEMPDYSGLIEVLWTRYGRFVANGEYSIEDGLFRPFNPEEVRSIENALR